MDATVFTDCLIDPNQL